LAAAVRAAETAVEGEVTSKGKTRSCVGGYVEERSEISEGLRSVAATRSP
jgi:hypothetical protein